MDSICKRIRIEMVSILRHKLIYVLRCTGWVSKHNIWSELKSISRFQCNKCTRNNSNIRSTNNIIFIWKWNVLSSTRIPNRDKCILIFEFIWCIISSYIHSKLKSISRFQCNKCTRNNSHIYIIRNSLFIRNRSILITFIRK